jgi:MFS family permease
MNRDHEEYLIRPVSSGTQADAALPLVEQTGEIAKRSRQILINFVLMSIFFTMTVSAITAVIAFAGADFDGYVGHNSNGILTAAYSLSALFLGNVVMLFFGLKGAMVAGLAQYCVYLLAFLLARFIPGVADEFLVYPGAAIGGIASGYVWPAQGAYFSASCSMYAVATGRPDTEITGYFASVFAAIFMFGDITVKLIASGLKETGPNGTNLAYVVFCGLGVASVVGMTFVEDIKIQGASKREINSDLVLDKVSAALRLLFTNPKMLLMLPTQFTFGFLAAFLNSYVSSEIVNDVIGNSAIGYFAGIIGVSALIVSIVSGFFIKHTGLKWPMMLFGATIYLGETVTFIVYGPEDVSEVWKLVLLYIAHGAGRGVWESTNKAVIADFFEVKDAPAAFANVVWSNGFAQCVGYFLFPQYSRQLKASICTTSAALGIVGYFVAYFLDLRQKRTC